MQPTRTRPADRHRLAFSLIEMLVVTGIIAALIAILFPVVRMVYSTALMTQCASNQRQSMMGMIAYAGDNDGRLPPPMALPREVDAVDPIWITHGDIPWNVQLIPYLDLQNRTDVSFFFCPAADPSDSPERTVTVGGVTYTGRRSFALPTVEDYQAASAAMATGGVIGKANMAFMYTWFGRNVADGGTTNGLWAWANKLRKINEPSVSIAMGEAPGNDGANQNMFDCLWGGVRFTIESWKSNHRQVNFSHFDGHVSQTTVKKLVPGWDGTTATSYILFSPGTSTPTGVKGPFTTTAGD